MASWNLYPSSLILSSSIFFVFIVALLLLGYYALRYFFDSNGDNSSGNQQEYQQRRHRLWKAMVILVFLIVLPLETMILTASSLLWYQSFVVVFLYYYAFLFIFIVYSSIQNKINIRLYDQLMHAIDIFVEHMELGYSLVTCFEVAEKKSDNPLKKFLKSVSIKLKSGQELSQTMSQSSLRVRRLAYIQYFIILMRIYHKTGAPLSDELRHLKQCLFQHKQDMQKQNVSVSLSKFSALITSMVPILMMIVIYWIYPDFVMPFLLNPMSRFILPACALILFLGVYLVFRVTQIKFYQINGDVL